jgi:catechol 2,3-dioxygenase-like lactoylglutathione lyase family enzyme
MLGEHPITPVLLAKDLAAARDFYHDKLGLQILTEDHNAWASCSSRSSPGPASGAGGHRQA